MKLSLYLSRSKKFIALFLIITRNVALSGMESFSNIHLGVLNALDVVQQNRSKPLVFEPQNYGNTTKTNIVYVHCDICGKDVLQKSLKKHKKSMHCQVTYLCSLNARGKILINKDHCKKPIKRASHLKYGKPKAVQGASINGENTPHYESSPHFCSSLNFQQDDAFLELDDMISREFTKGYLETLISGNLLST